MATINSNRSSPSSSSSSRYRRRHHHRHHHHHLVLVLVLVVIVIVLFFSSAGSSITSIRASPYSPQVVKNHGRPANIDVTTINPSTSFMAAKSYGRYFHSQPQVVRKLQRARQANPVNIDSMSVSFLGSCSERCFCNFQLFY